MLTSRLGFARSDAQPALFVDHARSVFIVVHVDGLIVVGSGSQLNEVGSGMKKCFTMTVTLPLSERVRGSCVTMVTSESFQPHNMCLGLRQLGSCTDFLQWMW